MRVLSEEVRVITVDCSKRLNQLIKRFCYISQKRENTWFGVGKKQRLDYHLDEISHQVRRHIRMQDENVLMSLEIKRIFGKRDKYKSKILVKVVK